MAKYAQYGFYTIDFEYLKYLYSIDTEVFYSASYENSPKPFIGIIIIVDDYKYFIPLTSAKEKHRKFKNICDEHFLVYELIPKSRNIKGDIYKPYSEDQKMHILSALITKKMIPVPEGAYHQVIFTDLTDRPYIDLLQKEYDFCLSIKDKVLERAEKIYISQKQSGKVLPTYCSFELCEKASKKWGKE